MIKEEPTDEIPKEQTTPKRREDFSDVQPTAEQKTYATVSKRMEKHPTSLQIDSSVAGAEKKTCTLEADESQQFIIGRDQSSDMQINDEQVSSKHCLVEFVNDSFIVRDLNSTNGTTLNGQEIKEARLSDGDKLKIGETSLAVKVTYDSTIQQR